MKSPVIFSFGLLSGLTVAAALIFIWNTEKMTKVHTLKQPLLVSSEDSGKGLHMLPIGTTLYFDKGFPEGFTRYKVYVNVDRMPLPLRELSDPSEIDPVEARAFDKQTLIQALRGHPLTRQELATLLESPHLTREEVKEVFADYLGNTK
jgi:hypothetical protein